MIKSFLDAETERLWVSGAGKCVRPMRRLVAWRRLAVLNAAVGLDDLRVAPGIEFDSVEMAGAQVCSVQVGGPYQVCFRWHEGNAYDVAIVAFG